MMMRTGIKKAKGGKVRFWGEGEGMRDLWVGVVSSSSEPLEGNSHSHSLLVTRVIHTSAILTYANFA